MVNKRVLRDTLVVVTGAGRGIGRATALAFAQRGARVVCVDLDGATADQTAANCRDVGGSEAVGLACDMADWDAVSDLAARVEADCGPVGVLVNNAGVGMSGRFLDVDIDSWRWIRGVNLDGVVHGCSAFGRPMLRRGAGSVVNVASGLAYTPRATEPSYVTTKAAVLALSRCLRADWGPHGVGVTAVCPGVTDTPIVGTARYLGARGGAEVRDRLERCFRHGRRPDAVASAIVKAVERDRAVVPTGPDARLGWWLSKVLPTAAVDRLARLEA